MTPVTQTKFGEGEGNCFSACIASILEIDISDVPNFCAEPGDWWGRMQAWLVARGLAAIEIRLRAVPATERGCFFQPMPDGLHVILSGRSPRGAFDHAVVGVSRDWKFVTAHDPHPSGAGLEGDPTHVMFFCPTR